MIRIVWEFRVARGQRRRFERAYGPRGDWARLFRHSKEYHGTELLRDRDQSGRYLTIDRWENLSAFHRFKRKYAQAYAELDKACEKLTASEVRVGIFDGI